jgi:hypothetical protein
MGNFLSDLKQTLSPGLAWDDRDTLHKAYTAVLVLFLVALIPMPYGYYFGLRALFCVCLYFFFKEIYPKRNEHPYWYYGVIALFILYNPLIPVHIGVHLIWAIINFVTLFFLFKFRCRLK